MSSLKLMQTDGVAYGPAVALPVVVIFLSAAGHSTVFVRYAALLSLAGIALVALLIHKDRPSRGHKAVSVIAVAVVASVAITHWPLRLGFNLAERRLEELASAVFDGAYVEREWAGWYPITGGRVDGSRVILEIGGIRYEDCAFVHVAFDEVVSGYRLRPTWVHRVIEKPVGDAPLR